MEAQIVSSELDNVTIAFIKNKLSDRELDDDKMEKIKNLHEGKDKDFINFAKLVVLSFDTINSHLDSFEMIEENMKRLASYLAHFESVTDIDYLRLAIYQYQYGESIGDYFLGMNIQDNIIKNRKMYMSMIRLFFRLFEEE
jgi:hypothetical protein